MTKQLEKQKARELRSSGLTLDEIVAQVNASKNSINKWVKDIILSEQDYYRINSRQAKYSYNLDIFKSPNEITYYLLGAFISDGCVDNSLRKISISSKDEDWLLSISNIICPNKLPIKIKSSNCFALDIYNKQIVNWFLSKECVPNKSLTVKMPHIPTEYFSHFVRGIFDGDGSITITSAGKTQRLCVYIVSASELFIKDLSLKLMTLNLNHQLIVISGKNKSIFGRPKKDYNDCYRIIFNGSNAVKFCEFIYQKDIIHLERKYQTYFKYVNIREVELKTCMIRKQFENPKQIIELLKIKTYKEVADMYGVTPTTIINRLKSLMMYQPNKNY